MLLNKCIHILFSENSTFSTLIPDVVGGLEDLCFSINEFFLTFFGYMKYIFALILIILGIMTLFRYRGVSMFQKFNQSSYKEENVKEKLKNSHVFIGIIYIFMGFGILFNYLIYILIWVLDPLPDRLFFEFINVGNIIKPYDMLRISNIELALAPHEATIYLCVAFISFLSLLQISVCIWVICRGTFLHPNTIYTVLIAGVLEGILAGFTTSLPFLI